MNDKRIQQVLDIEQEAQGLYKAALEDAKQLPIQAEQESQMLIDKARVEAENEARQILAKAHSTEESDKILMKPRKRSAAQTAWQRVTLIGP